MTQASIRVGIFKPGAEVEFAEIQQTLEALQKVVGGYIEMLSISPDDLVMTCNEEGKLTGLPLNRYLAGAFGADLVVGTFLVSRRDDEGDLASITTDDERQLSLWAPRTVWNAKDGRAARVCPHEEWLSLCPQCSPLS